VFYVLMVMFADVFRSSGRKAWKSTVHTIETCHVHTAQSAGYRQWLVLMFQHDINALYSSSCTMVFILSLIIQMGYVVTPTGRREGRGHNVGVDELTSWCSGSVLREIPWFLDSDASRPYHAHAKFHASWSRHFDESETTCCC